MSNSPRIQVTNFWNVSSVGLIVEVFSTANGLPENSLLYSAETKNQWLVKSRLIYNHTLDEQTRFEGEKIQMLFLSFENPEKADHSRTSLLLNEAKSIFQYILSPIEHNDNPLVGDQLEIIKNE